MSKASLLIIVLLTAIAGCRSSAKKTPEELGLDYQCTPAKEYITTLNYLRSAKGIKLAENEARKVAKSVSKGCRGAAKRFINLTDLLTRAKIDSASAISVAKSIALEDDDTASAFQRIFKSAYLADGLDLSLTKSMNLAKRLSVNFAGDRAISGNDFYTLVRYCVSRSELNLPRPTCASIASSLAGLSERFHHSVAKNFIQSVEFMRENDDGPRLSTNKAVKISASLIKVSPFAPNNFEELYRYAVAKKGLKMSRGKAVNFARSIAKSTTVDVKKTTRR